MTLVQLLKLLSAAKLPIAVTVFGLILNFSGSNGFIKSAGSSVALMAAGSSATVIKRRDSQLNEIKSLQRRHEVKERTLQASLDEYQAANAENVSRLNKANAVVQRLNGTVATLEGQLSKLQATAQADRAQFETQAAELASTIGELSEQNTQCANDASVLAGKLHDLEQERTQLIFELYETAVTEVAIASNIATLEKQFADDKAYQIGQKKKAKSELTQARANYHTELAEAGERIEELEALLAEKTQLAQNAIAELQHEANGQFTQIGGQVGAQNEVIQSLRTQLEESRKTIKAYTHIRFDNVGTDNIIGNRLIDALAKQGCDYSAHDNRRQGHNGRLQVWLRINDAPLTKAQAALDEIHSDLNLWAKPSVKVDRGMHLFTLATEQEHKVVDIPADNLKQFEKAFDAANHIRLVGPTGSGKSTFLDNLIWLGRLLWPTAEMELLDPKAPFTVWQGGIVPNYKNMECVPAIANISEQLQARFAVANEVAEKHGNDSESFHAHVDTLAPYLFVLDEAQYLYRMAKAEDAKSSPKGKQANLVRDSLLDCLGVGRALKCKGYFITQSAKCSKLGMNEDDFDNATSLFLGSAIANALEGELKGSYSDAKLAKVEKEYHHRKQLGQKYLALISFSETDTLFLIQCPSPGFYHARVCEAQKGLAPQHRNEGNEGETLTGQAEPVSAAEGAEMAGSLTSTASSLASAAPSASLEELLKQGTHCPKCGTHTTSYKRRKPNGKGNVSAKCNNKECTSKTFSWKPLVS